ncbi:MAG: Xaa-Pro dipeptidase [Planctomycetota bacterium]|jgi:Xaa-Pro dipeptidase
MTQGIGGSDQASALAAFSDRTTDLTPISKDTLLARIARAQELLREAGQAAMVLYPGSSMVYFTGLQWYASERLVAAILPAHGELSYIAPAFERDTLNSFLVVEGALDVWEEHECPYELVGKVTGGSKVALDASAPFFVVDGLAKANPSISFENAMPLTQGMRSIKSAEELALMQRAKDITLEVHKSVASILRPGITTTEVEAFIDAAHRASGAPKGSSFVIVLFGPDSAFPHGVKTPKALEPGDVVLIDTGCFVHSYQSDITRTYIFGDPTDEQRRVWNAEKAAQAAAFEAAQVGTPCGDVDLAARRSLEADGFGPGYALPGLPHRTGHGIGLDIHEGPYLVSSDRTPLQPGMCFSNEPMLCVPGAFGIRLEDHFYMTADGPRWFTQPSPSIDSPF